tara:strand:- start:44 stop:727 length:684 start_codon:yes stop_codon:yes gene_type:complete
MDKAKEIIAHFLKIHPNEINEDTIMDYNTVPSSVMLIRMYTTLAENNYIINDISEIITYRDFKANLVKSKKDNLHNNISFKENNSLEFDKLGKNKDLLLIGVDIENINDVISNNSLDSDQFLSQNFTQNEIEYCKKKYNPQKSFAGLFSLKESIVKADNSHINLPFSAIEINHDKNNKPYYKDFFLSVSHNDTYVFTIAIKLSNLLMQKINMNQNFIEENILNKLNI